jgi:hypothetical protein
MHAPTRAWCAPAAACMCCTAATSCGSHALATPRPPVTPSQPAVSARVRRRRRASARKDAREGGSQPTGEQPHAITSLDILHWVRAEQMLGVVCITWCGVTSPAAGPAPPPPGSHRARTCLPGVHNTTVSPLAMGRVCTGSGSASLHSLSLASLSRSWFVAGGAARGRSLGLCVVGRAGQRRQRTGIAYSDEKVANRDIRVWHGATENGP